MKDGDGIPGLVGWEWHGEPARDPRPGGRRQRAAWRTAGLGGDYTATIYPGPKDNFVFNAATIWWADGLSAPPGYVTPVGPRSHPRGPDPRVQRITANLFRRMRGG